MSMLKAQEHVHTTISVKASTPFCGLLQVLISRGEGWHSRQRSTQNKWCYSDRASGSDNHQCVVTVWCHGWRRGIGSGCRSRLWRGGLQSRWKPWNRWGAWNRPIDGDVKMVVRAVDRTVGVWDGKFLLERMEVVAGMCTPPLDMSWGVDAVSGVTALAGGGKLGIVVTLVLAFSGEDTRIRLPSLCLLTTLTIPITSSQHSTPLSAWISVISINLLLPCGSTKRYVNN